MRKIIEKAFEGMVEDYKKIFKVYYPAHGSNGFTERNQTYYFTKNLISLLGEDSFVWTEAPLPEKQHIDAFVISSKTIFYIESKRIKSSKITNSIRKDIERLSNIDYREHLKKELLSKPEKEYIIYLSDVWLETKLKKQVPYWWSGNNLPENFDCKGLYRFDGKPFYLEAEEISNMNWSQTDQMIYRFTDSSHDFDCLNNYCLMLAFCEVK